MPMRLRSATMSSSRNPASSRPKIFTEPWAGSCKPAAVETKSLRPDPRSPPTIQKSPGRARQLIPLSTTGSVARAGAMVTSFISMAGMEFSVGTLEDEINDNEKRVQKNGAHDTLRDGARGRRRDVFDMQRLGQALKTGNDGNDRAEAERFQGQQDKILPAQGPGQLAEILIGPQGNILQKSKEIARDQGDQDQINRERENGNGQANDSRHDEVMNRIHSEGFEHFDFTQRARRAQLDDGRSANTRQHDQRGDQRTQFAHHHQHHDDAQIILRPHTIEPGDGLTDDDEPESEGEKTDHGQQTDAGAENLVVNDRVNDFPGGIEFGQRDAQRDQSEGAEALQGIGEAHQFVSDKIQVSAGQRREGHKARAGTPPELFRT